MESLPFGWLLAVARRYNHILKLIEDLVVSQDRQAFERLTFVQLSLSLSLQPNDSPI